MRATSDGDVRIAAVDGDVRVSRGHRGHIALQKRWEQAQSDEPLEPGYAVATGNGSAEIELESGSTVFLAANSLLLFSESSWSGGGLATHFSLATGTASIWTRPGDELITVETPTDSMTFSGAKHSFVRVDAYLDGTVLTNKSLERQDVLLRDHGDAPLAMDAGATAYLRGGRFLRPCTRSRPRVYRLRCLDAGLARAGDAGDDQIQCWGTLPNPVLPPNFVPLNFAPGQVVDVSASANTALPSEPSAAKARAWDDFVAKRVGEKEGVWEGLGKIPGLTSAMPGLAELSTEGSFFECPPYGTCWEPGERAVEDENGLEESSWQRSASEMQSPSEAAASTGARTAWPAGQIPGTNPAVGVFQPRKVEWTERQWGFCGSLTSNHFSRVARTPSELQEFLRLKANSEKGDVDVSGFVRSWRSHWCGDNAWVPYGRRYAMVLRPRPCQSGMKCKPVVPHAPRAVLVRVAGKLGVVPRHPNDVEGTPSRNLKEGMMAIPERPGQAQERVGWGTSQKMELVEKLGAEEEGTSSVRARMADAPQLQAHLVEEVLPGHTAHGSGRDAAQIVLDCRTQQFLMPRAVPGNASARQVAVGGVASNGRIASFVSGASEKYYAAFARSSGEGSHRGGEGSLAGRAAGSGSSGASSGSAHNSGGGSSSGSAAASSSASSSGGGRPH
jgi:hypothetical protein